MEDRQPLPVLADAMSKVQNSTIPRDDCGSKPLIHAGTILADVQFKRILLKLSGEALKGPLPFGVDPGTTQALAEQIKELSEMNVQIALVIGGGNIFRGIAASSRGMERVTADYIGMLATVMNGLAMQDALEKCGVPTRVQTAIEMRGFAEPFIRRRAIRHLEKGRVVIFAAGTGSPYFTTDTTAALRATEIGACAILKATKVDGIYSDDPETNPDAIRYETLTYQDALEQRLKIMDASAFALCMDNQIPIIVCNFHDKHNLRRVVCGDLSQATIIDS